MQLALTFGYIDVDSMLNSISSQQFSDWQTFYRIHPFGAEIDSERFAMQQANLVNAPHWRFNKPRQADDYMPIGYQHPAQPQTIEQQIAILKLIG
jgi:hypothetical protein